MGVGGISFWQLLIILVIVLLVFGSKRLRTLGSDLGESIKGFREAMNKGGTADANEEPQGSDKPDANRGNS